MCIRDSNGSFNHTDIKQGSDDNFSLVMQDGETNVAIIDQSASGENISDVMQSGVGNISTVRQ